MDRIRLCLFGLIFVLFALLYSCSSKAGEIYPLNIQYSNYNGLVLKQPDGIKSATCTLIVSVDGKDVLRLKNNQKHTLYLPKYNSIVTNRWNCPTSTKERK